MSGVLSMAVVEFEELTKKSRCISKYEYGSKYFRRIG